MQDYVHDIDSVFVPAASKWMCSRQCPCLKGAYSENYANLDEAHLNKFGRSKLPSSSATLVSLYFLDANTAENPPDYTTFSNCFYEWKNDW
jgi:hypothetical protein